jgi:hypothetical protein
MLYHFEAWDHTCKQFGLEFSPQLIVEQAGKPVHELFNIVVKRSGKVRHLTGRGRHASINLGPGSSHALQQMPGGCAAAQLSIMGMPCSKDQLSGRAVMLVVQLTCCNRPHGQSAPPRVWMRSTGRLSSRSRTPTTRPMTSRWVGE